MRAAIVINDRSGGALGQDDPSGTVERILRDAGIDVVAIPQGPLDERLDAAIAAKPDAVVIGGGDGSICAAASRLAGTGVPLGIVPMGTMNLLARDLGLPETIEAAAAAIATAHVRHVDVAAVNGHLFLNACMVGLPTHLGRLRERARGSGLAARWRFLVGTLRGALRHPPMRLLVTAEGREPRRVWTRAIAISCNTLDTDAGRIGARAKLDGGTLSLYVAQSFGIWWMLQFAIRALFRRWAGHPDLDRTTATAITIGTNRERLHVMNDGEAMLLDTPLRFIIRPGALAVLANEEEKDRGTDIPRTPSFFLANSPAP